jgi:hypothetical protein
MTDSSAQTEDPTDIVRRQLDRLIQAAALAACGETSGMPEPDEEVARAHPFADQLAALFQVVGEMASALAELRERAGLPRSPSWRASQSRPAARFRGGPGPAADSPQLALQRVRDDLIQRVGLAPAAIILFGSSRKAQVSTAAIDRDGFMRLVESVSSDEKLKDGLARGQTPPPEAAEMEAKLAEMLGVWRKYLS